MEDFHQPEEPSKTDQDDCADAVPTPPPLPNFPKFEPVCSKPSPTFEPLRLHFAINADDFEEVEKQVNRELNLNYIVYGFTPLMVATLRNQLGTVRLLLKHGAQTEIVTEKRRGARAMHFACRVGNLDIVKDLRNYGALLEIRDHDKSTPLHWAAYYGHFDTVAYLCEHVDVNCVDSRGRTPLYNAIDKGEANVTELLLLNGANVNHLDNPSLSPLMMAAIYGYVDITKLLIEHGANVNQLDGEKNSILFASMTSLSTQHLQLLATVFFDPSMRSRFLMNDVLYRAAANHKATENNCKVDLICQLLDSGYNFETVTPENLSEEQQIQLLQGYLTCRGDVWELLISAGVKVWLHKIGHCVQQVLQASAESSLNMHKERVNNFFMEVDDVQPLLLLSKVAIRKSIKRKINERLTCLPLPEKLREFCMIKCNEAFLYLY